MFLTAVGTVQDMKRRLNGSKLSILTLRHSYAGQTVTDGTWGEKGNGFFQYRVWEENNMAGTNSNFVRFMDSLKPGSVVEVLAEATMIKTVKDGTTTSNISLTAIRLGYVSKREDSEAPEGATRVAAARDEDEEGYGDDFAPDPIG